MLSYAVSMFNIFKNSQKLKNINITTTDLSFTWGPGSAESTIVKIINK